MALVLAALVPLAQLEPASAITAMPKSPKHVQHNPGPLPVQRSGSADGQPREVDGGTNRAVPPSTRSRYPQHSLPQKPATPANTATVQNAAAPRKAASGFNATSSKELPARRTRTEQVYANPDGTETTVFSAAPLNYQDAGGAWQPIKPTLTAGAQVLGGGTGWKSGGGAADVQLALQLGTAQLARVSIDGEHEIGWGVQTQSTAIAAVNGGTASYANFAKDADLQVAAQPGGLKETIVLKSVNAPRSYTFPLYLKGLTARLDGSNISLFDAAGKTRADIPAGSMQDATGNPDVTPTGSGVHYRLTGAPGHQVLQMNLDDAWLSDPHRTFPVQVDPTVAISGKSQVFQIQDDGNSRLGDTSFDIGLKDGVRSVADVLFPDVDSQLAYHKIFGAQLGLVNYDSASCAPRPVTVFGITQNTGNLVYPGPAVGPALASSNFAYGYVATGAASTKCAVKGSLIDLGTGGRDLVQRWVNYTQINSGLLLRASVTDPLAWKTFAGTSTANPPKLYVTHSPYNAKYEIPNPVPNPPVLQNQDGTVKVTVTNQGAEDWTPSTYYLAYRVYNSSGALLATQKAASLPYNVSHYNISVTLSATIKALPPGKYTLDFTMVRAGGAVFTDENVPPARLVLAVYNVPPVVTEVFPPNGYETQTLTPQLWAKAVDKDAASSALTYKFTVCPAGGTCFDSGFISSVNWTVPVGKLAWNKSYSWSAIVKDATSQVNVGPLTLLTDVPQPDVTSHLSGAPSGDDRDFDPLVGNYSTSAIDAPVVTTGPALSVARVYNSLDPRTGGAFGAGWSTLYDMSAAAESDSTGNVRVTLASGREVRFGTNSDGTYVAPTSERLTLTSSAGTWVLRDAGGNTYTFAASGPAARHLQSVQGPWGRPLTLSYDTAGKLTTAVSGNSGRTLTFSWSGAHVSSVAAPAVGGTTPIWTYTYDGDQLTKVCAPGSACTSYGYSSGSHYRSAVLDAKPDSYWRLGETAGTDARSEVAVNLGKDTGHYGGDFPTGSTRQPILGWPGALAGTSNTAAQLEASTSDQFTWPDGSVKRSRDSAIEMWFKTQYSGALMGYEDKNNALPTLGQPILYIGQDGKLRGQFRTAQIAPITSAAAVNNNSWHHVVLSAFGNVQTLYLDGAPIGTLSGVIDDATMTYAQIGRAYVTNPTAWPQYCYAGGGIACPDQKQQGLSAVIDEPALYSHPLGADVVAAHYHLGSVASPELSSVTLPSGKIAAQISYDTNADRVSEYTDSNGGTWKIGLPSVTGGDTDLRRTVEVRDPADRIYLYEYDALTGQMLRTGAPTGIATRAEDHTCTVPSQTDPSFCTGETDPGQTANSVVYDADGFSIRSFTYNAAGQLQRVYNEVGNYVDMTYDARGNITARLTCRITSPTPACSTTRYTFPASVADPLDPLGDKPTEMRDGRSTSATDNRYLTRYTYT
ncbi:MAG TPA: LamG-like jellyroll fold domain-containing protein, partial [Jatrophihabitantaceae bacterium]|nr:LamG-like jellyroll fold domain-containing protein [Jatrophihabitantaceae bacterium]